MLHKRVQIEKQDYRKELSGAVYLSQIVDLQQGEDKLG
jgi:hypothetical protein